MERKLKPERDACWYYIPLPLDFRPFAILMLTQRSWKYKRYSNFSLICLKLGIHRGSTQSHHRGTWQTACQLKSNRLLDKHLTLRNGTQQLCLRPRLCVWSSMGTGTYLSQVVTTMRTKNDVDKLGDNHSLLKQYHSGYSWNSPTVCTFTWIIVATQYRPGQVQQCVRSHEIL